MMKNDDIQQDYDNILHADRQVEIIRKSREVLIRDFIKDHSPFEIGLTLKIKGDA